MRARLFGVFVASAAMVGGVLLPAGVASGSGVSTAGGLLNLAETTVLVEPAPATVEDDIDRQASPPPPVTPAPGLILSEPRTVRSNGAVLAWSAYTDPSSSTADDLVEYQVFRGCLTLPFAGAGDGCAAPVGTTLDTSPRSRATLVGVVAKDVVGWADTSAVSSSTEDVATYRYWVVARTQADVAQGRNGSAASGAVTATMPLDGRTRTVLTGDLPDTSFSYGASSPVASDAPLRVGPTRTRSVIEFDTSAVPSRSRVLSATVGATVVPGSVVGTPGSVRLYGLTRDFAEASATWTSATSTIPWSTPGGDLGTALSSVYVSSSTPSVAWTGASLAGLVQTWVDDAGANHGVLARLVDESTRTTTYCMDGGTTCNDGNLRTTSKTPTAMATTEPCIVACQPPSTTTYDAVKFVSADPANAVAQRPLLTIEYASRDAGSMFAAPEMPERWVPNTDVTVPVRVLNTTTSAWPTTMELGYRWGATGAFATATTTAPDGVVALGRALAPGESVTVQLPVKTPINSDRGSKRLTYDLLLDLRDAGAWWSSANPPVPVSQSVRPARGCGTTATGLLCVDRLVEDPTSDELGLEKFGTYTGEATGQGAQALANLSTGNALWTHDLIANPSVGPSTFVRMTYNSNDVNDPGTGFGWSVQASTLTRLGSRLSVPNGNSTNKEMSFTDGDGTTHFYRIDETTSTSTRTVYRRPAGVHLDLVRDRTAPEATQWVFSRPDGTRFFYSQTTGLPTSVVDLNDNTMTFTHDADGRLISITDAKGRTTLTLGWEPKRGSNTGRLLWLRDISGRGVTFRYTATQQLAGIADGGGFTAPGSFTGHTRSFGFSYATESTNKHARLLSVTDPRGQGTSIDYQPSGAGPVSTPNGEGWVRQLTDRNGVGTTFAYQSATDGPGVVAEVTDLNGASGTSGAIVTTYRTDGYGRTTMIRDANANAGVGGADQSSVTKMAWDADHNVTQLTEPNGAVSTWEYDPVTGYPKLVKDAEAVKDNTAGTQLTYEPIATAAAPVVLASITTPQGNTTSFGHDGKGNLTSVTDPLVRKTTYVLNGDGTTARIIDPKQNQTQLLDYDATGQPGKVVDALTRSSMFRYDVRGNLIEAKDALGNPTTVQYDDYGRLTKVTSPHQGAGETRTDETFYDDNDNVDKEVAPTGATSSHTFSYMDELRSTTLPPNSDTAAARTITYDYDPFGRVLAETAPRGTATTDPNDFVTRYTYDRIGQVVRVEQPFTDGIDGAGTAQVAASTYAYDLVGNLTRVLDPNKVASPASDYTATMTYDLTGRRTSVTDAAGYTSRSTYDRDGNLLTTTDQDGNVTTYAYDVAGQPKSVTRVRNGQELVTTFGYDANGNRETVTRPSGRVQTVRYDVLDRPSETIGASDASAAYGKPARTYVKYDEVGRVKKQSAPTFLETADAPGLEWTTYDYWPSGDVKVSTDPWGIQATYGYNKLGQQTSRALGVAAASDPAGDGATREMTWAFWPDGSLKQRTDAGAHPAQVADNSGPFQFGTSWTRSTAQGQEGDDHRVHAPGGTDTAKWQLSPDVAGNYTLRATCPKVTGATTSAAFTVKVVDGASTTTSNATVDQVACQSSSTAPLLGTFTFKGGEDVTVTLAPSASGTTVADAVKLRKTDSSAQRKVFTYAYDANGQTRTVTDGAKTFTTDYDGLGRALRASEAGGATGARTTTWSYDLASNLLTSYASRGAGDTTGSGNSAASRFTRYTLDERDLVASVASGSAPDATLKTSTFTYDARGMRATKTKPNGNVTTYGYYSDGLLKSLIERKGSGTLVASHDLDYDRDGDRKKDVSKVQNPEAGGYLEMVADYAYTPSQQLASVTKTVPTGAQGQPGRNESYCYDAAGNVTEQKVGRSISRMGYERGRLLETQTKTSDSAQVSCPTPAGDLDGASVTLTHQYDAFGRASTVSYKAGLGARPKGTVVKRYGYDGFDRVVREQSFLSDGTTNDTTTTRSYDAFDRTTSRTSTVRANPAVSTRFVYLGTSDQVAFEEQRDTQQAWKVAKAYTYGPGGEPLSLRDTGVNVPGPDVTESNDPSKKLADGASRDLYYESNPHGDVETLTGPSGDAVSTYRYTAYGSADPTGTIGIDAPDDEVGQDAQPGDDPVAAPSATSVNPYRFNAKRFDSATGSYDMGFRDYDPGLNRYTSRDMYNGALADMSLGIDPWNTNRYAFAGGNPISGVELDGHLAAHIEGGGTEEQYEEAKADYELGYAEPIPIPEPQVGVAPFGPGGLRAAAMGLSSAARSLTPALSRAGTNVTAFVGEAVSSSGGALTSGLALGGAGAVTGARLYSRYGLADDAVRGAGSAASRTGAPRVSIPAAGGRLADGAAGPKLGWSVGDDIYSLTKAGNSPAWSTVRARFWKNEALNPQYGSWNPAQLGRMSKGRAPQRYNPDKGGMESMDLSHEPVPYRNGGTSVVPRWPQDHAAIDPYRYPGY